MDLSKIGNARQQDDNRFAVSNALRLGECHHLLAGQLTTRDDMPLDYVPGQKAIYEALATDEDGQVDEAWVWANISADKATELLRDAIAEGKLHLWCIHYGNEIALAPNRLDDGNIRNGIFKTYEFPEPDLQGAALWVKRSLWRSFLASVAESAQSSDANIGDKKIKKSAPKKPGPQANEHWPEAIRQVTDEATTAGYSKPLMYGQKEGLIELLCSRMADLSDWHCSTATARKYVGRVIDGLPER